jgi:hypothetical protein
MRYIILFIIFAEISFGGEITLNKKVSPVQDYFDFPLISIQGPKNEQHIGYGIHIDTWTVKNYMCRMHFNELIKLEPGTKIVLSDEFQIEKLSSGLTAYKFFVVHPKEISYICCGVYIDHYRSLMGENTRLIFREFPEKIK